MTARVRAMSEYEWATLNALRSLAWRWACLDEICQAAREHFPVRRRVVRHHLDRFAEAGLVDRHDPRVVSGGRFRWAPDPPADAVDHIEATARAEGFELVPVAPAPMHCTAGHVYALVGHRWADGSLNCFACGEVSRDTHGHVGLVVHLGRGSYSG